MASRVRLRAAVAEDIATMVSIQDSAFRDDALYNRCFPPSDPATHQVMIARTERHFADAASHAIIAEAADESSTGGEQLTIIGWARWIRRPLPAPGAAPAPPRVLTEDMYPAGGDRAFAARFFQANQDALSEATKDQPYWFLSMIAVAKEHQRRGVASMLMRFGVDEADREGWAAYVNASPEGKALYERFGFRTVQRTDFGGGITTDHMKREGVRSGP